MIKPMLDHIGERATTVIGLSINVIFLVGYSWMIPEHHSSTSGAKPTNEKERKKRDKFQGKIERIKRQEIAEVKRDADSRVSQALLQSRSVFEPKTASLV